MSDVFILYVAFSYLYMAGTALGNISGDRLGKFVSVGFSPVLFPFVLGIIFVENNQD